MISIKTIKALLILVCGLFSLPLFSQQVQQKEINYYVSPKGNDENAGTNEAPFATWERARKAVRENKASIPVTVWFRAGTYYLSKTLELTAEDSGVPGNFVTYRSYPGEQVIISGAQKIDKPQWSLWKDNIYRMHIADIPDFDQLFINGNRQIRARFPNYDSINLQRDDKSTSYQEVVNGSNRRYDTFLEYNPKHFSKKSWSNPTTGIVHAFQSLNWGNMQYRIKNRDTIKKSVTAGRWRLAATASSRYWQRTG